MLWHLHRNCDKQVPGKDAVAADLPDFNGVRNQEVRGQRLSSLRLTLLSAGCWV